MTARHAAPESPPAADGRWPLDATGRPVDLATLVLAGLVPEPELSPVERYRARRRLDEWADRS